MKIKFDFSLFTSPSAAYGHVEGEIAVEDIPRVGAEIDLLPHGQEPLLAGLHRMRVERIIPPDPTRDLAIAMLSDVVTEGSDQARRICSILEEQGFWPWPYQDN
jgi:hypothetical protein